jgi:hypothetical protein
LEGVKPERKFTFDHALWSFDGFTIDEKGYNTPDIPKYKDQLYVWEKLGTTLLDNAWKGKNSTIFAYGQTGAGKSFTTFGYGANKGIVPQACVEIFNRIKNNKDADVEFQVTVVMVEIYMDRLQDLLVEPKNRKAELKIREAKTGIYIENVRKEPVTTYDEIQSLINMGESYKSVSATKMNSTSSRGHTIVTISITKVTKMGNAKSSTQSIINIVDLAGSEKST